MRKNIRIGKEDLAFEANLGTARLYEKLTGQNILVILMNFKNMNDEEKKKYAIQLYNIFEQLAYVMNVQATSEDIKEMKSKMNEDDFLEWEMRFNLGDFGEEQLVSIGELWASTQETHSESAEKNA